VRLAHDRLAYIQRKQLCSSCFASSHQFRDCTSAHNCLTCQDRYHTLLHRNSGPTTSPIPFDPPRTHHFVLFSASFRTKSPSKKYSIRILGSIPPLGYVKRAFNFRRQCRAAVLSRCLHLARSHCRSLSLSISPLSLRSALKRLS